MTSHAAVVARGMGKPCVCGCEAIKIDFDAKQFTVNGVTVKEGDIITVDGSTGNVMLGEVAMIEPTLSDEFQTLLSWADEAKRLGVRANADTPEDALRAREFGAQDRIVSNRAYVHGPGTAAYCTRDDTSRQSGRSADCPKKLLPFQRDDFYGILKAMAPYPVTIRLLIRPCMSFCLIMNR